MSMNSQTRIIVATAAALAVVDIAVRLIPMGRTPAMGATNGVVTAQEFRLVDQWGNERATMEMDSNGEPGIKLFDRFGTERAQLDTFQETPSLTLFDKGGEARTYYGMDTDSGDSIVQMYGDGGNTVTSLDTLGGIGHYSTGGATVTTGQTMNNVSMSINSVPVQTTSSTIVVNGN